MTEQLIAWLQTYPQWTDTLQLDTTGAVPDGCGLFPQGTQVIARQEDVLGNVRCRFRAKFRLLRVSSGRQDDSLWMERFAAWVHQQSAAGTVPRLGEKTWLEARSGRKSEGSHPGTAVHSIELIAEYTL